MTLDEEMTEFFRRSVSSNPATGIPRPFEIQRTEQTFVQPKRVVEEVAPRITLLESSAVAPPVPTISGNLQPNNGRLAGGSTISINGTGFIPGATVFIDNVSATNVVVVDDTRITCQTPAYTHGVPPSGGDSVDVKVVNIDSPNHFFEVVKVDGFNYYVAPTVASVTPNTGPGSGGTAVTITGTNYLFSSSYVAGFGGSYVATTRVDSTHLTCSTPQHAVGLVNVVVIAPDADHQTGTLVGGFTYGAPGGTPGAQANLIGVPHFTHSVHNANLAIQIRTILDASGAIDTTYNGVIHPVIMGISSNATATLPNVTMVAGVGTLNLQVFLVNLHASGDLFVNFTESVLSSYDTFEVYIDRFFNP